MTTFPVVGEGPRARVPSGVASIQTEESEGSSAEPKGGNFRQVFFRPCLPFCSQGQKDQGLTHVCAASDLPHSTA